MSIRFEEDALLDALAKDIGRQEIRDVLRNVSGETILFGDHLPYVAVGRGAGGRALAIEFVDRDDGTWVYDVCRLSELAFDALKLALKP